LNINYTFFPNAVIYEAILYYGYAIGSVWNNESGEKTRIEKKKTENRGKNENREKKNRIWNNENSKNVELFIINTKILFRLCI
jgi:hypothetical protein